MLKMSNEDNEVQQSCEQKQLLLKFPVNFLWAKSKSINRKVLLRFILKVVFCYCFSPSVDFTKMQLTSSDSILSIFNLFLALLSSVVCTVINHWVSKNQFYLQKQ